MKLTTHARQSAAPMPTRGEKTPTTGMAEGRRGSQAAFNLGSDLCVGPETPPSGQTHPKTVSGSL